MVVQETNVEMDDIRSQQSMLVAPALGACN